MIDEATRRRFWRKVDTTGDCWTYTGTCTPYGVFRLSRPRRTIGAHRLAWLIAHGSIPPGASVLHSCDNPPCVRPTHLFLGDHDANMADMVTKGRHWMRQHPERLAERRGVLNVRGKLTDEQVAAIRSSTERTTPAARRFGVSPTYIRMIRRGARRVLTESPRP